MQSIRKMFSLMEGTTLLIVVVFNILVLTLLQKEIKSEYYRSHVQEIKKIGVIVENFMGDNQKLFSLYMSLPDKFSAQSLLMDFTDIYYCGTDLRISGIIKKGPVSRIFPGYDISGSGLGDLLKKLNASFPVTSFMYRSPESDTLSIYICGLLNGRYIIGRIGLEKVEASLAEVADYTNSIIILATSDGYVLSNSKGTIPIQILPEKSTTVITMMDTDYLYTRKHSPVINKDIAIFTPLSEVYLILRSIKNYHYSFILVFTIIVAFKFLSQSIMIFKPLAAFSTLVRRWDVSSMSPDMLAGFLKYDEILSLYNSFKDKSGRIQEAIKALRGSEELFRQLTETIHEVFYVYNASPRILEYVSPAYEEIWGQPINDLYIDSGAFMKPVHHEDAVHLKSFISHLNEGNVGSAEFRIIRDNGSIRWIWARAYPVFSSDGTMIRIAGIAEDITDRKRTENLLRIQRDLGIKLSNETDMKKALEIILNSTLMIEGMDSGGIYIVDPDDGSIDLVCSMGLSKEFVEIVSHYDPDSDNARLILQGKPVYMEYKSQPVDDFNIVKDEINLPEGIKSLAILPALHMGITIAAMNIASKTYPEIPVSSRDVLESFASLLGSTIVRLRSQEQIRSSLREKEILLKEVHHRVKNNFQIITSLLNLQSKSIKNEELLNHFNESRNRIWAMSLIHEKLYQSGNFAGIDFAGYIETLVAELSRLYYQLSTSIRFDMEMEKIEISIDQAIPCSLIINEILSNAMKYAFPQPWEGEAVISVKLHQKPDDDIELIIGDNGIGIPDSINPSGTDTLGLSLIDALIKQLNGNIRTEIHDGTRYFITFSGKE